MENKKNFACRIFKEQFNLIQQLPKKECEKVLFLAIKNAFFRAENEPENEPDFNLSELGKCVLNLLSKNLVCKEFSDNYGGARVGAGRKNKNQIENQNDNQIENQNDYAYISVSESVSGNIINNNNNNNKLSGIRASKGSFVAPTEQEFLTLAKQWNDTAGIGGFKNTQKQALEFWNYYNSQGWLKSNGQHLTNVQSAYKLWVQRDNQPMTAGNTKPEPTTENKQEIKTAWVGFSADYDNIQDFDDNFPWDKAFCAYRETKNKYPSEPTGQKMREIMRYVYSNSDKLHRLHNVSPHLVFKDWGDFMKKDKCSWVDVF